MTPKLKKIIITVLVLGLAFIAYMIFMNKSDNSDELISGTNSLAQRRSITETKVLGEQITQALIQIESLQLDRSIFDSPVFNSLIDKSKKITSEPVGRRNPFAPLSDTSVNYVQGGDGFEPTTPPEESNGEDDGAENTIPSENPPAPNPQPEPEPEPDAGPGIDDLFGNEFGF
jgi:hypothetical protein